MPSWTFVDPPRIPKHLRRCIKPGEDTINGHQILSVDLEGGTWVESPRPKSKVLRAALDEQSQGED